VNSRRLQADEHRVTVNGSNVLATKPPPGDTFRRVRRRERLRSTFWFIPAIFVPMSAALAVVMHRVDEVIDVAPGGAPWWVVSSSAAANVLSTIAAAMLTFVGVVFSVTLVALQLASSQVSPRVLRNFVRSPVPKLAFGTFISTFVYSLFLLSQISSTNANLPVAGVAVALLLVLACIAIFIVYVDMTVRGMQVSFVVSTVAVETRQAILQTYRALDGYVTARLPERIDTNSPVVLDDSVIAGRRPSRGVIQGVDVARIVELAHEHDVVVYQVRKVGQFAAEGDTMFDVAGHARNAQEIFTAIVDLGRERTLYQDPLYGIRQLVDTATQALSPAFNSTTTAVQALDRLFDLIGRIGRLPTPTGFVADAEGTVRFIYPVLTWADVVELAFVEIRQFGSGATQITRRLLAGFDDLLRDLPEDRHAPIQAQRDAVIHAVQHRAVNSADMATAVRPDPMGLG
jgi:uncharacterized membrane protein